MLKLKKIFNMNVNWIDLLLSSLFVYGSVIGFKRGLIREIGSLLGIIISILSVYHFSKQLSNLIQSFLNLTPTISYVASGMIIFLTSIYLVSYISKLITKALNIVALGFLNRISGLIFGLLKWIVVMSSLVFLINKILFFSGVSEQFKSDEMESSIIYDPLSEIGQFIFESIEYESLGEWRDL